MKTKVISSALVLLGMLLIPTIIYAQTVRVIQQNVGPNGCNSSTEYFENGIHFLICQEPGKQQCKAEMYLKDKKERKIVSGVIKSVNKKIKNEALEGVFNFKKHKVSYEAEDAFNFKITIEYE